MCLYLFVYLFLRRAAGQIFNILDHCFSRVTSFAEVKVIGQDGDKWTRVSVSVCIFLFLWTHLCNVSRSVLTLHDEEYDQI